jgi:thiol-disulfide isomerase/thioredoxin
MYTTISNLGKSVDYHTDQANPLTYCLYPNFNSQWIHGSTTTNKLMTPNCEPCQSYMSQRCANKWDEACDIYTQHNQDTSWPNMGAIDQFSQKKANNFLQFTPNSGENLIRNSVEKRFFLYPAASTIYAPFDPNMASSPMYTKISTESSVPRWTLNPTTMGTLHDNDHYTNLMLNNPQACFDLLARFHKLSMEQPQTFLQLSGSNSNNKMKSFLSANNSTFQKFHLS